VISDQFLASGWLSRRQGWTGHLFCYYSRQSWLPGQTSLRV